MTVKSMQRQLLQIADKIPDDITLTLLKSFAKILSREPEPVQKTPFIRAFAKIRDDSIDKKYSAIAEENEEQLKIYESGSSEEDNECTFNYKMTSSTQQIVYPVGDNEAGEASGVESPVEDLPALEDGDQGSEAAENVDEGIEVEMPQLLPSDEVVAEFEKLSEDEVEGEVEDANEASDDVTELQEILENVEDDTNEGRKTPEYFEEEEVYEIREPTPTEAPKVSLDDIQREIEEMQAFMSFKGVKPEKPQSSKWKDEKIKQQILEKEIEDAYKLDFCLKLKNFDTLSQPKRHNHSKYKRSENYREEITEAVPIFDPAVPNTPEDFMKSKSGGEMFTKKMLKKGEQWDASWQNLCENQRKLYRWEIFHGGSRKIASQFNVKTHLGRLSLLQIWLESFKNLLISHCDVIYDRPPNFLRIHIQSLPQIF